MNKPPKPSTLDRWENDVNYVCDVMRGRVRNVRPVPVHVVEMMREILLGKLVDERLGIVAAELRLIRAAAAEGAILSKQIKTPDGDPRTLAEIISNTLFTIDG